jgi:capsular polysaccharide transport system ATP-binding protein
MGGSRALIQFHAVSKRAFDEREGARFVLRNVTVALPWNARVAIIGREMPTLTTVLHLLAGSETPDRGRVVADDRLRRSPLINSGRPGGTLVLDLTGLENINFFASVHAIDIADILAVVEPICNLGEALRMPVREYDNQAKRALEVSIIAALPYHCYFVDRLDQLGASLIWKLFHAVRGRGAGLVFTTRRMDTALAVAEVGAVVRDGTIRTFSYIKRAVDFHEKT